MTLSLKALHVPKSPLLSIYAKNEDFHRHSGLCGIPHRWGLCGSVAPLQCHARPFCEISTKITKLKKKIKSSECVVLSLSIFLYAKNNGIRRHSGPCDVPYGWALYINVALVPCPTRPIF